MTLFSILAMATVVFLSRYTFIEPRLPLKLAPWLQRLLRYSAPAVLSAIAAPIVLVHEQQLNLMPNNPYLLAALLTFVLTWRGLNIMLSVILSTLAFLLLKLLL